MANTVLQTDITLEAYVEEHGQSKTAENLGITQGAVWQMLHGKRDIFVRTLSDGSVSALEVKQIGRAS